MLTSGTSSVLRQLCSIQNSVLTTNWHHSVQHFIIHHLLVADDSQLCPQLVVSGSKFQYIALVPHDMLHWSVQGVSHCVWLGLHASQWPFWSGTCWFFWVTWHVCFLDLGPRLSSAEGVFMLQLQPSAVHFQHVVDNLVIRWKPVSYHRSICWVYFCVVDDTLWSW